MSFCVLLPLKLMLLMTLATCEVVTTPACSCIISLPDLRGTQIIIPTKDDELERGKRGRTISSSVSAASLNSN